MAEPIENNKDEETKMLGANVPKSIYWKFKEKASTRNESMMEAILNAAMLYIEFQPEEAEQKLVVNK